MRLRATDDKNSEPGLLPVIIYKAAGKYDLLFFGSEVAEFELDIFDLAARNVLCGQHLRPLAYEPDDVLYIDIVADFLV